MFGLVKLFNGSLKLLNGVMDWLKTKEIKQAGRNENELVHRNKQDESKERADKIYDRDDDNVIMRMRNKSIPPKD